MMLALQGDLKKKLKRKKSKTEPSLNIIPFGNATEVEGYQSTTTAQDQFVLNQLCLTRESWGTAGSPNLISKHACVISGSESILDEGALCCSALWWVWSWVGMSTSYPVTVWFSGEEFLTQACQESNSLSLTDNSGFAGKSL